MTSPTEKPNLKRKSLFSKYLARLFQLAKGLTSALPQSASVLCSCKKLQCRVKKVDVDIANTVLKMYGQFSNIVQSMMM